MKGKKSGRDKDVETALKNCIVTVREKDATLSGPILETKVEKLAEMMEKDDFWATSGCFTRWQRQESIHFKKAEGEARKADAVGADSWILNVWPDLIFGYPSNCVYNADETALYYRAFLQHTFLIKGETINGVKKCKERVTIMSSKKKELVVIGKSKKTRSRVPKNCLFHISTLKIHR